MTPSEGVPQFGQDGSETAFSFFQRCFAATPAVWVCAWNCGPTNAFIVEKCVPVNYRDLISVTFADRHLINWRTPMVLVIGFDVGRRNQLAICVSRVLS